MPNELPFRLNRKKTHEVVLWVASKHEGGMDYYRVLKTILDADVYHLNEYGRPVTGDEYVAMRYGPVPDFAYQLVKLDPLAIESVGEVALERLSHGHKDFLIKATRAPDLKLLSESDIEALERSWGRCKDKTFDQLHAMYADHVAYKKVWANKTTDADVMNMADFVEDDSLREELKEVASRIQV